MWDKRIRIYSTPEVLNNFTYIYIYIYIFLAAAQKGLFYKSGC